MKKTDRKRGYAVVVAAACVVSCFSVARAEEALGAFSGAGGVARESENRALNAPKPTKEASVPKIGPKASFRKATGSDTRKE